jgi:uncharacterized membrane protein YdjX (TVP38/TMEM64 family)
MVLVAIIVFFPVVPYVVAAGVIGAVFGMVEGSFIALGGQMVGTMLMFFLARYGFRDWAQQVIAKYPQAKEYEELFEQNAFLAVFLTRVVPVIPAPVVNVLSGVSRIHGGTFFAASLLGKMPANLVFTFAGSLFAEDKLKSFLVYGLYFGTVMVLTFFYLKKRGKI